MSGRVLWSWTHARLQRTAPSSDFGEGRVCSHVNPTLARNRNDIMNNLVKEYICVHYTLLEMTRFSSKQSFRIDVNQYIELFIKNYNVVQYFLIATKIVSFLTV